MRFLAAVGVVAYALALPALAGAGGWASVGFEPLPDGTSAGGTWKPTIFVKQHGVTPLSGLLPLVTIEETGSGESAEFLASAGAEPGTYHADVVFPSAGDWRVTISSGFGDSHVTYGPVAIGDAATGGGSSEPRSVIGLGVVLLAVLGAVGALAARRARRLTPARG
jgi:hypothetical protein